MADIFLRINEGKVTLASDYGTITVTYPESDTPSSYPEGKPWRINHPPEGKQIAITYTSNDGDTVSLNLGTGED